MKNGRRDTTDAAAQPSNGLNREETAAVLDGSLLRRIKGGVVREEKRVWVNEREEKIVYFAHKCFPSMMPSPTSVPLKSLVEIRSGYATDNLHKAAKDYKFHMAAPEERCFSVIFNHKHFIHKSIDFVAPDKGTRDAWVHALVQLLAKHRENRIKFNEHQWFSEQFKRADTNKNGKVTLAEVYKLMSKLNLQMSERYVRYVFNDISKDGYLTEAHFIEFCCKLTERPELRHILRMFSTEGVESLRVQELQRFLTEEQQFTNIDVKKAETILDTYEETNQDKESVKVMGIMGLRRLLASRWGNIMKEGHEGVFQDMDRPLQHYFCNSSHNTYLTGLQMKGEATVEGYVAAMARGARLLELDIFDGEGGQPVITHKRTLIQPITLRDTLRAIKRAAFTSSPYPVILTLENHVSLPQQKVMAELFQEILGDSLYIPEKDSGKRPLPSPKALKGKFLLRGKKLGGEEDEEEEDEQKEAVKEGAQSNVVHRPIHPLLSSLIALPSVKLTFNFYEDIKNHPMDGSASLSESKVESFYDTQANIAAYTAQRFVKSYPKGLRQDSSNMYPVTSWLLGVQAVALNFQTTDDNCDINHALFRINGNCGYVLKPDILLRGIDIRKMCTRPKLELHVAIISAQYLPKSEPSRDIIDPYVSVSIVGMEKDEWKVKTKTIKDNGFNPVWNESFSTLIHCPEMAILRFVVKDFDSTSVNDFVGEFSIPLSSVRCGYSQIRLNTAYRRLPDESASLFVRIAIDSLGANNGGTH